MRTLEPISAHFNSVVKLIKKGSPRYTVQGDGDNDGENIYYPSAIRLFVVHGSWPGGRAVDNTDYNGQKKPQQIPANSKLQTYTRATADEAGAHLSEDLLFKSQRHDHCLTRYNYFKSRSYFSRGDGQSTQCPKR